MQIIRKCPDGVRSCFYAVGRYNGQGETLKVLWRYGQFAFSRPPSFPAFPEPVFRGCGGATYAHDEGCKRSLQTVPVNAGKSSVDIEINLCYCNGDNCNVALSGAQRATSEAAAGAIVLLAGFAARLKTPFIHKGLPLLGALLLPPILSRPAAAAENTSVAPHGTVTCYACGLPEANPKASFCDGTVNPNCNLETNKMYNLSCNLMDNMGKSKSKFWERWESDFVILGVTGKFADPRCRSCPTGVKSCFYAEGGFPGEGDADWNMTQHYIHWVVALSLSFSRSDPVKFRGCAGVPYRDPFHQCVSRKQAVPVFEGHRSVDIDVTLCYCNEDLCNETLNGGLVRETAHVSTEDDESFKFWLFHALQILFPVISGFVTLLFR